MTPRALARCRRGTASVEFAFLAPVLLLALTSLVDIGFAVEARMHLDSVLRATAQSAMADPGLAAVQTTADALASSASVTVTVSYACTCEASGTCTGICGSTTPHTGYRMVGTGQYDSFLTPLSLPLGGQLEVMVQ